MNHDKMLYKSTFTLLYSNVSGDITFTTYLLSLTRTAMCANKTWPSITNGNRANTNYASTTVTYLHAV